MEKKTYKLICPDGKPYISDQPGTLGGHNKLKIYGRLDCPSAKRYIAKGQYVEHRVFFKDEADAKAAGYSPCGVCMKEAYKLWKESNGCKSMKTLKYVAEDGVIIHIEDSNAVQEIRFSDIEKYWDSANEDEFEGGSAALVRNTVLFTMITAGGQDGIIAAWDLNENKVIHISNGAFCTSFDLYNDMLYLLCDISDFNTAPHYNIFRVPFKTMDPTEEGTMLYCNAPCKVAGTPNLEVSENGIFVVSENGMYTFSSSPEKALTSPAPGAEKYYEDGAMADFSASSMLL